MRHTQPFLPVPALLLAALLSGALLAGCEMFAAGSAADERDELEPGLYTFPGIYSAGASEYLAQKVNVSPFTLENALSLTVDPGNYLVVIDRDETLPTVMQITSPGVCLVIRGRGGERRISRTGKGPLFNVRNSELILESGIVLSGDPANTEALVRLGRNGVLELYEGARITGNEAGGVEAGTEAASAARFTIYGGSDTRYNITGAMGGIINIITKKKQTPGWSFGGGFTNTGYFTGRYNQRQSGGQVEDARWEDLLDTQMLNLFGAYGGERFSARLSWFGDRAANHYPFFKIS